MSGKTYQRLQQIQGLIREENFADAKILTDQIEKEAVNDDGVQRLISDFNVSAFLLDIGAGLKDVHSVNRGITYLHNWLDSGLSNDLAMAFYNLGVGYESLFNLQSTKRKRGTDHENHRLSRHFYRLSSRQMGARPANADLASLAWTNYGNMLRKIGRDVEAFSAYDAALTIKPNTGKALGNKGAALSYFAHFMLGFEHLLYTESKELLESALQQSGFDARCTNWYGERALKQVNHAMKLRKEIKEKSESANHSGIQPKDDFQAFLCEFSATHDLFMSPISFLGEKEEPFYGDPVFISLMYPDARKRSKFDRYISFLNEIKQEYVLGRYFLVQSQYESSTINAVDDGVSLYRESHDNAVYNTYIQLLKSALKQAIAVLDKVAYFLYDYCEMTKPALEQITFLRIWGDLNNEAMQKAFKNYESPYLLALFTLARDLFKEGDWNPLIEYRGIVTHRFMILHESLKEDQINSDIPRGNIENFLSNAIFALQKAPAAVMYLILFVHHREISNMLHESNDCV